MRLPRTSKAKIPGIFVVPFIILVPIGLTIALPMFAPAGTGPGWDDESPGGHSMLIERLSARHEVRALEGSIALLPEDAGAGDVFFLFPTYRPATQAESTRLNGFVDQGGLLIVATAGGHGANWTESLGVRFQGLPALSAEPENETCLEAPVSMGGSSHPLCMKAATSFPNTTRLLTRKDIDYDFIGRSDRDAFIDTNGDDRLSLGDQGPMRVPLVLQWSVGDGRIVAIADGTVWQNGIVEDHRQNLEAAAALAEERSSDGAIYFDSTASQPRSHVNALARPIYAGMSIPDRHQWTAFSVAALGLAGAAWLARRASPWQSHQPVSDAEDSELEFRARLFLSASMGQPRTQDSKNNKQVDLQRKNTPGPQTKSNPSRSRSQSKRKHPGDPHGRR